MQKKSVLIVDDDDDIRNLLCYNLEKNGFHVETAVNGKECLSKLKSKKPNLILLDVMMPEMDGLEVCEQIKSEKENADILALRGSIFLGLGSVDNFVRDWRKALELDENLPLSYSNYVLRELQNQGLLDDKFRKNF
mgnify:CR=1 FL=1